MPRAAIRSARRPAPAPLLALALLVFGGCGGGPSPSLRVVRSTPLGIVAQSPRIVGRDGGISSVAFGRSIWAFGDTVITPADAEGQTWHHNSFASAPLPSAPDQLPVLADPLDAHGAPRYLVAPTADEARFNAAHRGDPCREKPCGARWAVWPGSPIPGPKGYFIPYSLIYGEPGELNFHGAGDSIATWDDLAKDPVRPTVAPGSDHPTILFPEYGWTQGAQVEGGMLLAFACVHSGFGHDCQLARAPLEQVLVASAWEVWTGSAWSRDRKAARSLFHAGPNISVFRPRPGGDWVVLYGAPLSNEVKLRTAARLEGPWSEEVTAFVATRRDDGSTYDANVHPEWAASDGAIQYVTWSRGNGNGWFGSELAMVRLELAPGGR